MIKQGDIPPATAIQSLQQSCLQQWKKGKNGVFWQSVLRSYEWEDLLNRSSDCEGTAFLNGVGIQPGVAVAEAHRNSLETQQQENVYSWKPLPEDW
jgi:hypothetical protein